MNVVPERTVIVNCVAYTGDEVVDDALVEIADGRVAGIGARPPGFRPATDRGAGVTVLDVEGAIVAPGFVDIQVNGGGDVLFNDEPTAEAIRAIAEAHARFGTTSIVPTYITGPVETMHTALAAALRAHAEDPSGILGVHFEGPAISRLRSGVHDPSFILDAFPLEVLAKLPGPGTGSPVVVVTLAPEVAGIETVRALRDRGVVVSVGHSDASFEQAMQAFEAGATCVTHLFNGMSPLTARAPGVVGAALAAPGPWVGLIADGHHCHPGALRTAIEAKPASRCILVTDAMPPAGGSLTRFTLGPYRIEVHGGRCTVANDPSPTSASLDSTASPTADRHPNVPKVAGTLAGSTLDMASAVRFCVTHLGVSLYDALRMASLHPSQLLGLDTRIGRIRRGHIANLVIIDPAMDVVGTVRAGRVVLDN